ncbi:MAG: sugar phosphate isomerase/epimerase [Nitrospinae bacterium]|nr:sugar phosphate isomerase/epimerase [Nitrospinota bacterium]
MAICSISTSWRSDRISDARELVDTMAATGINALELEFRIPPETFAEILKNRERWNLTISSLHAVCPAPVGRGRGAERDPLNETDEEKRKRGVKDVLDTLRNASEMGARAVVVHCGYVPMAPDARNAMLKMHDAGKRGSREAEALRQRLLLERAVASKKAFTSVLKSLEEINEEAVKRGVDVGIENRYYLNEFPFFEDFGVIFNLFEGGRLGYWHDAGHAHVMEFLYGIPHEKMLETYGHRLIGVHLHDVLPGGYTDHNEPGCGTVDFAMVKKYLKEDTIRVMELSHRVAPDAAKRGVEFLKTAGIFY